MKEQLERIQELENQILKLPQGSITYKTIHGKKAAISSVDRKRKNKK